MSRVSLGLFALLVGGVAPLNAQLVTFQLAGLISGSNDATFTVGNPFTWTVTMDTGVSPVATSGSSANGWARYNAITAINFDYNNGAYVGSHTFSSPANVLVQNHSSGDIFSINYFGPVTDSDFPTVNGGLVKFPAQTITLSTAAGNALHGWDLTSPVGQDWFDTGTDATDVSNLTISGGSGGNYVSGYITSASVIPEPGTYAAILGGAALLGVMAYRRKGRMAGSQRAA